MKGTAYITDVRTGKTEIIENADHADYETTPAKPPNAIDFEKLAKVDLDALPKKAGA